MLEDGPLQLRRQSEQPKRCGAPLAACAACHGSKCDEQDGCKASTPVSARMKMHAAPPRQRPCACLLPPLGALPQSLLTCCGCAENKDQVSLHATR